VRPTFVRAQKNTVNVWYVAREKDVFKKKDDIITAAEKYMQENGTDAFRDLVNRVYLNHECLHSLSMFFMSTLNLLPVPT